MRETGIPELGKVYLSNTSNRQQVASDASKAIEFMSEQLEGAHLWSKVEWCSHSQVREVRLGLKTEAESKVCQLGYIFPVSWLDAITAAHTSTGEKDVLWLQIPVDDAMPVQRIDTQSYVQNTAHNCTLQEDMRLLIRSSDLCLAQTKSTFEHLHRREINQ